MSAHGIRARLVGSFMQPRIRVTLARNAQTCNGKPALVWVKGLPDRSWDPSLLCWWVNGLGADPHQVLRHAGVDLDISEAPVRDADPGDLVAVLAELTEPVVRADPTDPNGVLIRPRLAGPTYVSTVLIPMAEHDPATGRLRADVLDLVDPSTGGIRAGLTIDADLTDRAQRAWKTRVLDVRAGRNKAVLRAARLAGLSPSFTRSGVEGRDDEEVAEGPDSAFAVLEAATAGVPDWFGLDLYEYQQLGVRAALAGRSLVADAPGAGKALPLDTRVPTPGGWSTIGQIQPGDQVFARDGSTTTVLATSEVHIRPVFDLHLSDGQVVTASDDHEWLVSDRAGRGRDALVDGTSATGRPARHHLIAARLRALARKAGTGQAATITEILAVEPMLDSASVAVLRRSGIQRERQRNRCVYALDEALSVLARWHDRLAVSSRPGGGRDEDRPPLERIVTTAELADLTTGGPDPGFTIEAAQPLRRQAAALKTPPYRMGQRIGRQAAQPAAALARTAPGAPTSGGLAVIDVALAVARDDDRIPAPYLRGSAAQRLELLRGLMDVAGTVHGGGTCEVVLPAALADDTAELVRSLGLVAHLRDLPRGSVRLRFLTATLPFRSQAKAEMFRRAWKRNRQAMATGSQRLRVVRVEPRGTAPVRCLLVDHPEHLFLVEGFVPTHNTRQALAAAAAVVDREQTCAKPAAGGCGPRAGSGRTLIVVPPVVLTHWAREAVESYLGIPDPSSKATWWPRDVTPRIGSPAADEKPAEVVVVQPGRKMPAFPDRGVVIVADSILVSRPALVDEIVSWSPSVIAYDEAHRARTWTSARSQTVRGLVARVRDTRTDDLGPSWGGDPASGLAPLAAVTVLPLTGTPMFTGSPVEMIPLLSMTGHLDWVFGGRAAFAERFCRRDHFGRWVGRMKHMEELRRLLDIHVWVRRYKADILPWLPEKRWVTSFVDVSMTDIRAAQTGLEEIVGEWLDEQAPRVPDETEIEQWCRSSIGLLSPLRKATGLAKVPAAAEHIETWLAENPPRPDATGVWTFAEPLVLWAHHREVIDALAEHARDLLRTRLGTSLPPVGVIDGSTSLDRRTEYVDAVQARHLGVLVCQITTAGVGLTLTACANPVFVESDWTAQLMSQAEDRHHRPGQDRGVTLTALCATGTLDEHVVKVRNQKEDVASLVVGDRAGRATRDDGHDTSDALAPWQLLAEVVERVQQGRRKPRRTRKVAA